MDSLSSSTVSWLGQTAKLIYSFIDSELSQKGIDLTVKQWIVLRKLVERPGLMQRELAMQTGRNKTSLTRLIQTMEQKRLVIRKIDEEDGRAKRIFISVRGKAIYTKSLPVVSKLFNHIQGGIPEVDLKMTKTVMQHMQDNVKARLPFHKSMQAS